MSVVQVTENSVKLAIPDIDLAFVIFEDFERPGALFTETVFRILPSGKGQCLFVKAQKQRAFDSDGRLCRVTHFWESVSSAVYKSLRDANVESKLDPLQRGMQNFKGLYRPSVKTTQVASCLAHPIDHAGCYHSYQ